MRLSLFFIFIFTVSASAAALSQNVSLNVKSETLNEVLSRIKNEASVQILYDVQSVRNIKVNDVSFHNVPVKEALDRVLRGTGFEYREIDDVIVIRKSDTVEQQQEVKASGTVTDEKGGALVGVTVTVRGTLRGTATDAGGRFSIGVRNGETLIFSYVGMKTREIVFNGQEGLNVTLEEAPSEIDKVVVTGIFNKSAASFTGSATTISNEELKRFGSRNMLEAVRNIDPSFNIVTNNTYGSDPNRLPEIQIRGNSSLPNIDIYEGGTSDLASLQDDARADMNRPLVIIDGFESSLQTMIDMNDNDVESITLLKDVSATAIYGSRGANGVIVITTRSPLPGKLKITYRGSLDIEAPDLSSYSLMNARQKLQTEYDLDRYNGITAGQGKEGDVEFKKLYNHFLNEVNNGVDTYWLSKPLRTGVGQNHNVRLEGGDNMFRYSISAQFKDVNGVMKESTRRNFNGTISLSYFYKNLRFTNQFMLGLNNSSQSPYGNFSTYSAMNPYLRTHDENGNLLKILGYDESVATGYKYFYGNGIQNPLYNAQLNVFDKEKNTDFTNNFSVEWFLLDGLTARGRFGVGKKITRTDQFYPPDHTMFNYITDVLKRGRYTAGSGDSYNIDASVNLSYSKLFAEKHLLYAGADYNIRQSESEGYTVQVEGFPNEDIDSFFMALQYMEGGKPSGFENLQRSIGLTATVNYTYDNRYYADLSLRMDGNSAFGAKKRFGTFWSAGLGWNIHNEKFMENVKFINRLKLRGSVGLNGSENFSSYQALSTYKYYTDASYGGRIAADLMALGNENLKWQQKMNYNLGFDIDLLDNRLSVVFDIYQETTKDLISSVVLPASKGFSSYVANIGEVRNRGVELKVTGVVLRNTEKQLYWNVSASLAHNRNKIVKLSKALFDAQEKLLTGMEATPNTIYREGYSTNTIWAVRSLGINPVDGKEIFLDLDGNVTTDWNSANITDCGINTPKYWGNLNTTFRYRNWMLTASFGYRLGGQVYNSTLISKVENINLSNNLDTRFMHDRWQNEGDQALYKVYNRRNTKATSRFVQDEQTLTCQNLFLSYFMDSAKLKQYTGISRLELTASMADVFYWSSVKRERGLSYPFSRQFSLGVNITF